MDEVVEKAYVYATRETGEKVELLVFEHRDHDAGVQIPKGSLEPGEPRREAAVRELREESGVTDVRSIAPLATDRWFSEERERWFRRHFFHVETGERRDRWDHRVTGGGEDDGMVFRCYWLALGAAELVADMNDFLDRLA